MTFPALRRVWLPWLLLLVPTLAIGTTALWLLRNEQRRLEVARADTLSRASQAARAQAQLAADNIELLVAEIRDGLIRELAETPEDDLDPLLRNWPGTNPLVSQTFLWRAPNETLAWPDTATSEHRAFLQRHSGLFDGSEPGLPRDPVQSGKAKLAADQPALPAKPEVQIAIQLPSEPLVKPQAKEEAFAFEAAAEQAALQGNSTVNLSQELRRDAYTMNRLSAAEAKRAARGDVAANQAELDANTELADASKDSSTEGKSAARPVVASATAPQASSGSSYSPVRQTRVADNDAALKKKNSAAPSAAAKRARTSSSYAVAPAKEQASAPAPRAESASRPEPTPAQVAANDERASKAAKSDGVVGENEKAERAQKQAEHAQLAGIVSSERRAAETAVAPAASESTPVGGSSLAESPAFSPPAANAADRPATADEAPRFLEEQSVNRSGWITRRLHGQTYFLGWWQSRAGAPVRGVELNLPAVLERVQALVPVGSSGEKFRLLGPAEPARDADVVIPLASTIPGWSLAAWFAPLSETSSSDARGFFAIAVLLVLAFAGAILAGGTIFFRQAATAERDAALKTSFVSNVSHEMKTPLTTIRMYAEMLADERVSDPEKRRRYFATIGRETTRLARLVNNALDFGRLEAGRKEYRAEKIALGPWLARLAEVHAPRLAEAGMKLGVENVAADAAVRADADSLEQMTLNLLDNAAKYAAAGGEIALRVEPAAGGAKHGWALVVADRGPGVPAAHRERIFERFHRVDDALTAKTQGAGLGLTIARRLARDQGGDVSYRAREGGGAEFVLTLPAGSEP